MTKKRAPICPRCGTVATKSTTRFGIRYDHCGMWAWGRHPLADAATHKARQAAHAAFDPLWQRLGMNRGAAYTALADALGIEKRACHMKLMTADLARRVPAIAAQIRVEINNAPAKSIENTQGVGAGA